MNFKKELLAKFKNKKPLTKELTIGNRIDDMEKLHVNSVPISLIITIKPSASSFWAGIKFCSNEPIEFESLDFFFY